VALFGGLSIPSSDITVVSDTLGAKENIHFGFTGGYYITDRVCGGLYFNYTRWGIESDHNRRFQGYDVGAYFKYAFVNESYFEPYLKASAGMLWPKYPTWVTSTNLREQSYDPGFSLGGYLGVLWYTSEFGSIFIEGGYHRDLIDGVTARNLGTTYEIEGDSPYFEITGGVTVFFGPE
jgi:hypothetical protein